MKYTFDDTIVALVTAQGKAAVALIRISGTKSIPILKKIFTLKNGKALSVLKPNRIYFGDIHLTDEKFILDEVLVSVFKSPYSYTGEDVVEISCHGSIYIQQKLIQVIIDSGARHAEPGEFTFRAYRNGKMDLSQSESVAAIIASENKSQHTVAIHQLKGDYSKEISELKEQLIQFASLLELELDFSEEDVEFANRTSLNELLQKINSHIAGLLSSFKTGSAINEGIPVVIAGKPNAGKSTLLNAILKDERAIVSPIAGTTRDTIEETIHIKGIQFRFIDTAGLRESEDEIESIGVSRAIRKMKQAALVVYLIDGSELNQTEIHSEIEEVKNQFSKTQNFIFVVNKSDLMKAELLNKFNEQNDVFLISAKNKKNINELIDKLFIAYGFEELNLNQSIVIHARHFEALSKAKMALDNVVLAIADDKSNDLIALDLRHALHYIGEICGGITHEDVLSSIFSKFCIGK